MRIINLPDITAMIEDDVKLEKFIRFHLDNALVQQPYCNFQFDQSVPEYNIQRFTNVANKINWWLETHNRPGKATVSVYVPPAPEPILEVMPEPEAPVIQEEQPVATKKKKNV